MADDKVKHLDYDKAIEIYESIGDKEAAKNARKLKISTQVKSLYLFWIIFGKFSFTSLIC